MDVIKPSLDCLDIVIREYRSRKYCIILKELSYYEYSLLKNFYHIMNRKSKTSSKLFSLMSLGLTWISKVINMVGVRKMLPLSNLYL